MRTFTDVSEGTNVPLLSVDGGIRFICNTGQCLRYYLALHHRTHSLSSMSLEVTMADETVIAALWGMTPCNLVEKCEHFGLTHFLFSKEVLRLRHSVLPKRRCLSTIIRGVTCQKKSILKATELLSEF